MNLFLRSTIFSFGRGQMTILTTIAKLNSSYCNDVYTFPCSANPRFLLMGLPGRDTPRAQVFGSVVFKGILFGLPPGFQTLTINEIPELGNNCRDAGPPYDPLEMNNAGYFTVKRHLGDLGSLLTEIFGTTLIHKIDPTITLSDVESNRFVVGRSIVVSVNMLDLQDDREGARIACGIIEPI
ncbi:SOD1 [Lepeophtheirus salmonis]|uniref:SOD1 n=1 Tax=Lepeophtheirus salmonis TaxID=72036 RepID=A0A7R8H2B7_LEPSM|nr:SOD1 [Lepeophtheirus salmonis]CAF2811085.1 SOD1 [Lepeophtheirus salmonis]